MHRAEIDRILQRGTDRANTTRNFTLKISRRPNMIPVGNRDRFVRYFRLRTCSRFETRGINNGLECRTRLTLDLRYMIQSVSLFFEIGTPYHRQNLSRCLIETDETALHSDGRKFHAVNEIL